MLVLGSLLALLSGMFNATAAALEKREGLLVASTHRGLRLLALLARRPLWLLAIGLSAAGWVCEAASLATAPVPVVATLRNAGRGMLVVGGGKWLDERFSRLELTGVALASSGAIITAVAAAHTAVVRSPLSNSTELLVAVACATGAAGVASVASRLAGPRPAGPKQEPGTPSRLDPARRLERAEELGPVTGPAQAAAAQRSPARAVAAVAPVPEGQEHLQRREKAAGTAAGAAVGLLFAGTGVFTKEIGDRFAIYGVSGLVATIASAGPWLMICMSVWAQGLIQQAFRRANAATVSAAVASVSSIGLIGSGFVLYREALPSGPDAWLLLVGIAVALTGTGLLIGSRPGQRGERGARGT